MMERKLKRERIILKRINNNNYSIFDKDGNLLVSHEDDYFIYMKNVNFRKNGEINGRYLGSNPTTIIDDHCKDVEYDNKVGYTVFGKPLKSARMVAINNKNRTIIIID